MSQVAGCMSQVLDNRRLKGGQREVTEVTNVPDWLYIEVEFTEKVMEITYNICPQKVL
jgi:hypothetical protein